MARRIGYRKHTKDECIASARQYTSRLQWRKACNALYMSAYVYGWLEECCAHMIPSKNYRTHLTRNKVMARANEYDTKTDFAMGAPEMYRKAFNHGYLSQCFRR